MGDGDPSGVLPSSSRPVTSLPGAADAPTATCLPVEGEGPLPEAQAESVPPRPSPGSVPLSPGPGSVVPADGICAEGPGPAAPSQTTGQEAEGCVRAGGGQDPAGRDSGGAGPDTGCSAGDGTVAPPSEGHAEACEVPTSLAKPSSVLAPDAAALESLSRKRKRESTAVERLQDKRACLSTAPSNGRPELPGTPSRVQQLHPATPRTPKGRSSRLSVVGLRSPLLSPSHETRGEVDDVRILVHKYQGREACLEAVMKIIHFLQ
uniref:Uncharacterized protein n=1 Tax=Eutreptiella gymnastica TaxID=73025 RepID=A0A7S1NU48_9EUGL|mmetsp:Transcript_93727/g.162255  ORF Transcript_93727/g.162255 Transcript_93727/m.162255 type:complete len:263 (+) Transcript_93727:2-790(+)